MTSLREAAQMALDALEHLQTDIEWQYKSPTRAMLRTVEKSLRAALAQPEQEPVALDREYTKRLIEALYENSDPVSVDAAEEFQRLLTLPPHMAYLPPSEPLYTAPPRREWQGLTDEEIRYAPKGGTFFEFALAIEAKLKEKNA